MEVTYQRDIRSSYRIVTVEPFLLDYQVQMCQKNRLEGLLPFELVYADGKLQFWYEITGKQSLEDYLMGNKLDVNLLLQLMTSVLRLSKVLEEYLLDEDAVSMAENAVYIDYVTHQLGFCYFPGQTESFAQYFHNLMEYLLVHLEHADRELTELGYGIYQRTMDTGYSMEQLYQWVLQQHLSRQTDYVKEERLVIPQSQTTLEENAMQVQEETSYSAGTGTRIKEQLEKMMARIGEVSIPKRKKHPRQEVEIAFEPEVPQNSETMFLGNMNGEAHREKKVLLKYQGEDRRRDLYIEELPYLIGNRAEVEGVIEQEGISRMHARITRDENCYYLEDLNSRNGTWVNGELISYQNKVLLMNGTLVTFAGENYFFVEQ